MTSSVRAKRAADQKAANRREEEMRLAKLEGRILEAEEIVKKEAPEDAPKVLPGTIVKMDYVGWLPTGCLFDSSFLPGMNPLSFLVGNNQAIPGIEES